MVWSELFSLPRRLYVVPSVILKLNSINIHLPLFLPLVPFLLFVLECYVDANLYLISEREICANGEDWEFKVGQWLNSSIWGLICSRGFSSFSYALPQSPTSTQAWLSIPSPSSGWDLLRSLTRSLRNPPPRVQPDKPISPHRPLPPAPWQEKTAVAPFKNPHCTLGSPI